MFNRKAGDNIAQEFLRIMGQDAFKTIKKEASDLTSEDAASYLVAPEEAQEEVSSALDTKIADAEKRAGACEVCEKEKCECEKCDKCGEAKCDCGSKTDDVSHLIDSAAQELFEGLGKIASSLRGKDQGFAADMVEATVVGIRDELLKEASKKLFVLNSLTKMASNLDSEGDVLAADMVKVTIEKIKNG